jgi:Tol biopolymer transport system component
LPVTVRLLIVLGIAGSALFAAAPAHATSPGPNGKIAFVKNGDIYAVNPDGSGLAQLTNTSGLSEAGPAFSPDGNYIAFMWTNQVFIMRSDGTEKHYITSASGASDLAWSPDGTKLAFFRNISSSNKGIWTMNVDGTGLTNLITADNVLPGVSWSPDGTKLAFSRGNQIWTINADGAAPTQLTFDSLYKFTPNWSPDGTTIAFAGCSSCSEEDIYTIPSTGGSATLLTSDPAFFHSAQPVWSPDGTKILFAECSDVDCANNDLYVMKSDGSGATLLEGTPQDESDADWQPAVGPPLPPVPEMLDKIAFVSTRNHTGINYPEDIFTMNPDGSAQRALTDRDSYDASPDWSPNGSKIAFDSNRCCLPGETSTSDIYVMNPDGSGVTNLTQTGAGIDEGSPAWSPDDARIAYVRSGIWVMNANGSGQSQLTNGTYDTAPAWSPDGTKIAFRHLNAIWTMNPDGTGLTQITTAPFDGWDSDPDWSPDGTAIAFDRYLPNGQGGNVSNVWKMNADGTGQQQLTTGAAVFPSWSPDGMKIAFSRQSTNAFYRSDIFVMNSDGTGQVDLTNSPGDDLMPDWKRVAGYPRPRGATPLRLSLVPAYQQCTSPNDTHGVPLSDGSCAPPQLSSSQLTVGTPDSNGKRTTMKAYVQLTTVVGNQTTPSDVQITTALQDVFNKDLSDYTGQLRAELPVRITDKNNTPSSGGPGAATTEPFLFGFDVPCTATPADATVGSDCTLTTTINTLYPGAIVGGKRAIWQMGRGRIDDSGPDGNPDTTADNTVFLDQGVFVP